MDSNELISNTKVLTTGGIYEIQSAQVKYDARRLAIDHAQRSRGTNGFNTSVADLLKDADEIYEWLIKDL
jgi:hypothetical protein